MNIVTHAFICLGACCLAILYQIAVFMSNAQNRALIFNHRFLFWALGMPIVGIAIVCCIILFHDLRHTVFYGITDGNGVIVDYTPTGKGDPVLQLADDMNYVTIKDLGISLGKVLGRQNADHLFICIDTKPLKKVTIDYSDSPEKNVPIQVLNGMEPVEPVKTPAATTEPVEPVKAPAPTTEPVEPVKVPAPTTEPVEPVKAPAPTTEPVEPVKAPAATTDGNKIKPTEIKPSPVQKTARVPSPATTSQIKDPVQSGSVIFIETGDIITNVNGKPIRNIMEMQNEINKSKEVMEFDLINIQNNKTIRLSTKLSPNGYRFGIYFKDDSLKRGVVITSVMEGSAATRCKFLAKVISPRY